MRFFTTAILTISLAAAASSVRAEDKAQPNQAEAKQSAEANKEAKKEEKKASKGKRFLRSVGSFSAGMVVTDPYSEGRAAKKSAR
jgi:hypothetical protein